VFAFATTTLSAQSIKTIPPQQSLWHPGDNPAVLLGAAERRDGDSPAELLRHLNLILSDMHLGGFATCLCADISAEGELILANAGHLAPYRNGDEHTSDSALPLGLAADADYAETKAQLTPGDTLTFLSDGVVEAQNASGELLGFERTRAISTLPAQDIARAAQHHGQCDDITVLTLTFAPADIQAG
jgi:serine phosphatase RsbU (regulator of sigma subunit)